MKAAADDRLVALVLNKVDEIKRLVLQSRAEVRSLGDLWPACESHGTACAYLQADSKLQAQGVALRRALSDELRESLRTSLGPRMDRSFNEVLGKMENAVCSGVDRMAAEVSRSSGIVAAMAEQHAQVMPNCACLCAGR